MPRPWRGEHSSDRLPRGIDRLDCAHLLEANYKEPCLSGHPGYIPGTAWHLQQAVLGYSLMTGEEPDPAPMQEVYRR